MYSLLLAKADDVPGKRDLTWLAFFTVGVTATLILIILAGMYEVITKDVIATLLGALVAAMATKQFDRWENKK